MNGRFFVFEGPDGVGKTTLVGMAKERLGQGGRQVESFSFPGRIPGTIGELIYRVYHNPDEFKISKPSILSEQLLFTAAHVETIISQILPSLRDGKIVLLDRFWWSTWVYARMGGLREDAIDLLIELEKIAWDGLSPDGIFLISRDQSLVRCGDQAKQSFLAGLYEKVLEADHSGTPVIRINNSFSFAQAEKQILDTINVGS